MGLKESTMYRVWFTTGIGLELFHDVEAENIDEAREKATREIKDKSPEIELEYRYAWEIIPSRRAEKSHAGILLFNEGEESR